MPLLLVDLDNTLIDRAAAVDRWARKFAAVHGRVAGADADTNDDSDADDAAWLVAADRDGLEPRERFAAMIAERFGLDGPDEGAIPGQRRRRLGRGLRSDRRLSRTRSTSCSAANRVRVQAIRARRQNSSVIASYSRSRPGRPMAFSGTCSSRLRSRARSARKAGSSSW